MALCAHGAQRGAAPPGSRAASHPVDQLVAGNAVLFAESQDLLLIDRIRQNHQRLVGHPRITQATQGVNYRLPTYVHGYHQITRASGRPAPGVTARRREAGNLIGPRAGLGVLDHGPRPTGRHRAGRYRPAGPTVFVAYDIGDDVKNTAAVIPIRTATDRVGKPIHVPLPTPADTPCGSRSRHSPHKSQASTVLGAVKRASPMMSSAPVAR